MCENIAQAVNLAVADVESAFAKAGWVDGWGLTDEEVRVAQSPLFYRNETSTVASEARVTLDGQSHSLYCIYSIPSVDPLYAGNRPYLFSVTVALTFYSDDAFLFYEKEGSDNLFVPLLADLLQALSDRLWTVSAQGDSSVSSTDDNRPYLTRNLYFASNNF